MKNHDQKLNNHDAFNQKYNYDLNPTTDAFNHKYNNCGKIPQPPAKRSLYLNPCVQHYNLEFVCKTCKLVISVDISVTIPALVMNPKSTSIMSDCMWAEILAFLLSDLIIILSVQNMDIVKTSSSSSLMSYYHHQ